MAISAKQSLLTAFATQKEQTDFLGWMRVLTDDVAELAASLATELSLAKFSEYDPVYERLNLHPSFWNAILLAQQTELLVVIGRIYDTGKGACLKRITKFIAKRKWLEHFAARFQQIEAKYAPLIGKVNNLRNNVFAHSSENKSLHVAFGFEGLTWVELEFFLSRFDLGVRRISRSRFRR